MSGPDVTGVEEYAEKAARDAVALRVEERTLALADELCADHRADHPLDHCQECYDLACTVSDSSWLAASLEAARVEERERIAREIEATAREMGCTRLHTWPGRHTVYCKGSTWARIGVEERLTDLARIARGEAT